MPSETDFKAILMVDDDSEDCLLTRKVFQSCGVSNPFFSFNNGDLLLGYLSRHGSAASQSETLWPVLILLDLSMPKADGKKILGKIKGDANLRKIPVVVFSGSKSKEDVLDCYRQGANSYITKPRSLGEATELIRTLKRYWLETVVLPPPR